MRSKKSSWNNRASRLLPVALLLLSLAVATPAAAQASSDALLKQADRYMLDGKTNQARAAYERAIAAGAKIEGDYVRARSLGLCYMDGTPSDLGKAARWLEIALRLRPDADDTRIRLAQSLAWGGRPAEAVPHFRTLAKANPNSADLVLGLANALYGAGNQDESFSVFSAYLERRPSDSRVRLEYARNLGYARRFTDALGQYQAVLQAEPDNVAAQVGVAKIFSWQDNLDTALQLYDKVLERHPQSYDALVGKAFTLMWMGRKNDARNLFQTAQRRNPSDRDVATALRGLGPAPAPRPATPAPTVAETQPPPAETPQPEVAPEPPAEVAAAPAPPAKSEEETFVETLMAQAEAAAAAGNYVDAVHQYHRVLERDPKNLTAKLQIARVLSWSKNYGEAAVQYEELLRVTPQNQAARQERARVLSWDTKFADSIAEYDRVLKDAEATRAAGQPEQISIDATRLEYARVLSWDKRYDDALAQFNLLLPEKAVREPRHKEILVEKARVQAWSRHYDDAVATYEQALVLAPNDFDARLGKAQATFWSGKLDDAALQLRPLLAEQPKHPETSFVLAAVERGRGHNGRALGLLKDAPQNAETQNLRSSIREDLRPILRLRYGFENSREIASDDPVFTQDTTYTAHHYTAGIEFFPHPDVSLEIFNTITDAGTSTPALARHGTEGIATETFARVNIKATPWLRLLLGAGGGTGGTGCQTVLIAPVLTNCPVGGQENRRQHFLYEIHPVITRGDFRLEVIASRRLADYTPAAIHNNVINRRETVVAQYLFRRRVRFGAEYWHATYDIENPNLALPTRSFEAVGNGGSFWVRPILFQNDRLTVDAGFRTELFAFDSDGVVPMNQAIVTGGFFTPHRYERYAATGHVSWDPHPRVHWELDGSIGPQRVTGFTALNPPAADFGITGSFGTELSFRVGRWRPFAAYNFFSTATIASPGIADGAYRSHAFAAGLSYRF